MGRSTVLDHFEASITSRDHAPVTLTVRIDGQDLREETIGVQAEQLRVCLGVAALRHRAAELLGRGHLGRAGLGLYGGSSPWLWYGRGGVCGSRRVG